MKEKNDDNRTWKLDETSEDWLKEVQGEKSKYSEGRKWNKSDKL